MKLIIKWLLFATVIMGTCYLPGISVESFWFAMLVAFAITIVNTFIKPLIKLVALPVNMLSFGLFNLVINLGLLYVVSYFIPQYRLSSILSAFIASIIITFAYYILRKI